MTEETASKPIDQTEPIKCPHCNSSAFHLNYLAVAYVRVDTVAEQVSSVTIDNDGAEREPPHDVTCDPMQGGCEAGFGPGDPVYERVIAIGDNADWPKPLIAWMGEGITNIDNPLWDFVDDDPDIREITDEEE